MHTSLTIVYSFHSLFSFWLHWSGIFLGINSLEIFQYRTTLELFFVDIFIYFATSFSSELHPFTLEIKNTAKWFIFLCNCLIPIFWSIQNCTEYRVRYIERDFEWIWVDAYSGRQSQMAVDQLIVTAPIVAFMART